MVKNNETISLGYLRLKKKKITKLCNGKKGNSETTCVGKGYVLRGIIFNSFGHDNETVNMEYVVRTVSKNSSELVSFSKFHDRNFPLDFETLYN